jgi:beta-lactam-binding protein with PASTA domain
MVSFVISKRWPIPVPDVVGKADTEAVSSWDPGFTPFLVGQVRQGPQRQVISQRRKGEAHTELEVTYVTSKGLQLIAVPDVTGMSKSKATTKLEAAGFKVSESYEFSSTVDSGDVSHQNPSAGGAYPPKTVVTITVSQGAGVTVPDFTSTTTLQDAIDKLKSLGLKLAQRTTTSRLDAVVNSTDRTAALRSRRAPRSPSTTPRRSTRAVQFWGWEWRAQGSWFSAGGTDYNLGYIPLPKTALGPTWL